MTQRSFRIFEAEVPGVAFLNIIFAVFQLIMVAYSIGQSAAVMVVNATLEEAAERDGYSNGILFTGPFFAKDGSYANGFSCAAYLIIGSLLHLGIGLLLLAGPSTQRKSGALCIVWYTFTLMFLIGHMTFSTMKLLSTPDDLLPKKWNDSEIVTEISFTLLILLEGIQIWIVYEFSKELKIAEFKYWNDTESPAQALSVSPPFPRGDLSRSNENRTSRPPRYSDLSDLSEVNPTIFKNVELK